MKLQAVLEVMECARTDSIVVEINGVQHPIQSVNDTSQGVVLVVDTTQEAADNVQANDED